MVLREEDTLALPDYHVRYCAFVDILGFSDLVDKLGQGATQFEPLRDLLHIIHEPPEGANVAAFAGSDFRAQSISDAVCISTAVNPKGFANLFYALHVLTMRMLTQGFFVRGAVVKGRLYHDDNMVFGEALVKAYRLEQEAVKYPRIMIASDVVADIRASDVEGVKRAIAHADDGPRYLDVLLEVSDTITGGVRGDERVMHIDRFEDIAKQIQRRFDESFDYPRNFEKVQWFAKYWNRTVREIGIRKIVGPGVDPPPAVWG